MPEVHVTRERVHFFSVDEDLHALDCGQVDGDRVDDGVDGEDLVERAAGMLGARPRRSNRRTPRRGR